MWYRLGLLCGARELGYRPGQKSLGNSAHSMLDSNMKSVLDFLELDEKVEQFCDDNYIRNYYEYESGKAKPIIRGRLKSALTFWRNEIKAPSSILEIINSGVKIDFLREPPKMYFSNNKSALLHSDFVTEAIKELLEYDLIKECSVKPHTVSPLSVAVNNDKKRLILDLSILNEYVVYERL